MSLVKAIPIIRAIFLHNICSGLEVDFVGIQENIENNYEVYANLKEAQEIILPSETLLSEIYFNIDYVIFKLFFIFKLGLLLYFISLKSLHLFKLWRLYLFFFLILKYPNSIIQKRINHQKKYLRGYFSSSLRYQ